MTGPVVDAEAVAVEWINSRGTLVGPDRPLAKGAMLKRWEGHPPPPYALTSMPTPVVRAFGVESPAVRASLTFQVYGPTKQSAADAAIELANELEVLDGRPAVVELPRGNLVTILVVDEVEGPAWQPDFESPRYIVTADWYLTTS